MGGWAQRIVTSSTKYSWRQVISGLTPRGWYWGRYSLMSSLMDRVMEQFTLGKFADRSKLGGAADTPNGCSIQRNRLKNWPEGNLMKLTKGKVLYLGRNNPVHQQLLEADWLGSSFGSKGMRLLEDTKLNMRNAPQKKANNHLDFIRKSAASSLREVIHWSTAETTSEVLCPVLGRPVWESYGVTEVRSAAKMNMRLEHLPCVERLRDT